MKRTIFTYAMVLVVVVLLLSCAGTGATYKIDVNESISADQKATITFINGDQGWFKIKTWNGSDISENLYGNKSIGSYANSVLTVPAGDNVFIFDGSFVIRNSYSSDTYSMPDIEMQLLLEAGKKYQVKGKYKFSGIIMLGCNFILYDVTEGSVLLKEWEVGDIRSPIYSTLLKY